MFSDSVEPGRCVRAGGENKLAKRRKKRGGKTRNKTTFATSVCLQKFGACTGAVTMATVASLRTDCEEDLKNSIILQH